MIAEGETIADAEIRVIEEMIAVGATAILDRIVAEMIDTVREIVVGMAVALEGETVAMVRIVIAIAIAPDVKVFLKRNQESLLAFFLFSRRRNRKLRFQG
jgi:hypothetical protein